MLGKENLSDKSWTDVLNVMYRSRISIEQAREEESSDIQQIADEVGVEPEKAVEIVDKLEAGGLVQFDSVGDAYLTEAGFAEGRSRIEERQQQVRHSIMFFVTYLLGVGTIIQSMPIITEWGGVSQLMAAAVFMLFMLVIPYLGFQFEPY